MKKTTEIKQYKRKKILNRICMITFIGTIFILIIMVLFTIKSIRQNEVDIKIQQKERQELFNEYKDYRNQIKQNTKELESFKYITPIPNIVQANTVNNDIEIKYKYAMYDTGGNRNDLTVDLLTLGDRLMQENNLDPNLLFGIIMVESEGHTDKTNPDSGAAGLGQFMPETGQFVYNKYIDKNKKYYHNTTPYNATCNLKMTALYLKYLYDIYDNSTMDVLKHYCGGDDEFTQEYYYKICNVVGYCIN